MKNTITTTLEESIYNYLTSQAEKEKVPRNSIIEKALRIYMKIQLEKQVEKGFREREQEYRDSAHDFIDPQLNSLSQL